MWIILSSLLPLCFAQIPESIFLLGVFYVYGGPQKLEIWKIKIKVIMKRIARMHKCAMK